MRCVSVVVAVALMLSTRLVLAQQLNQNGLPMAVTYATVRGTVMNAATNRALARALVSIEGDAATGALTDGEGHFEIRGVPIGQQLFQISKPGFLDQAFDAQVNFSSSSGGFAHNVFVATDMQELVFSLVPAASIRGHIDLSTDEPAEGINVTLLRQTVDNGRLLWSVNTVTKTNSEGNYRFAGLGAGVYVVYTSPTLDTGAMTPFVEPGHPNQVIRRGYPSVYYPAARDLTTASRIQLRTGEQAQANIDLSLEAFHPVIVKVQLPGNAAETESNISFQNTNASITDAAGHPLAYAVQFDQTTHTIQANLPDGTYTLAFSATVQSHASGADSTNELLIGTMELTLDSQSLANLSLSLVPMQPIPIHLRLPESYMRKQEANYTHTAQAELSPANAFFTPIDGLAPTLAFTSLAKNASNTLEFLPVSSGSFWASTTATQTSVCIGSFLAGSTDLAVEPLVINPALSTPSIELTVRDDCASLNIELPYAFSFMFPGIEPAYTVYVVPDFDTTATVTPYTLRASSGGVLTIENLTPGDYHVYAFPSPVELEYHNPAAMAALVGQAVTLAPAASSNLVLELPIQ